MGKKKEQERISLEEWRWINNLKQKEVAKKLGIVQSLISKVERKEIGITIEFKRKFEEAYGKEEADKILEFVYKKNN